jgi:predicted AlkP superfamily phosphohydrolase/phosphomutase
MKGGSKMNNTSRRDFLKTAGAILAAAPAGGTLFSGLGRAQSHFPKTLILGIDGMDHKLLGKYMLEGIMPNFKKLASQGGFSPLWSSMPPLSPVAWSNFITGSNPGGHAIFDFIHRDPSMYMPEFSMAKVEAAPETIKLAGITCDNQLSLPFSSYKIPFSGGKTTLMRKGTAFWELIADKGIKCTMFKMPSNFPPVETEARSISGMGTPDLLGTYGTFSYYTDSPPPDYEDISGGDVFPIEIRNGKFTAGIYGPNNDFLDVEELEAKKGRRLRSKEKQSYVEFTVRVDPVNPVARIDIQGKQILLKAGEFSDWVELDFEMLPNFKSVAGICRFYLKSTAPKFALYATPLNISPANPALPICTPPDYSKELYEEIGHFYTQGMPEETKAFDHGIFDNADFVKQSDIVLDERLALLEYELNRFDDGLLFFYISTLDLCGHMMWSAMDAAHPGHDPEADAPYMDRYRGLYREMDKILGRAMAALGRDDTIMVMSDHGFGPWYRGFQLNTWLHRQGYLVLEPGTDPESVQILRGVDWKRTRAYAMGFNGLYVNQIGRERAGSVAPGRDKERLLGELTAELEAVVDPKNGKRMIKKAYRANEIYAGKYAFQAPDILMGYDWGYRGADESALGELPGELVADNLRKWSGDHAGDYTNIPGVLVTNREIKMKNPALYDLTPTVLSRFGISKQDWMVGDLVF